MEDEKLSSNVLESNMHAIISCAAQGDIIALHKLVIEKIQWNVQTSRGDNAMHVAAKFGRYEFIHELIKLKFPLNVQNVVGETALCIAAKRDDHRMVRLLVEAGADIQIVRKTEY